MDSPSDKMMRYFEFGHLPLKLQHVSRHFFTLAERAALDFPDV